MASLKIKFSFIIIRDVILNVFFSKKFELIYVVEASDWSIKWDGKYITKNLNKQRLIKSRISTTHIGIRNKIIHFGSPSTFFGKKNTLKKIHSSNKVVLTWFHIPQNDKRISLISKLNEITNIVHTSCSLTRNKLIAHGLDANKIVLIPLGIDLNLFKPFTDKKRNDIKKDLCLPKDRIIIGSFQKDGAGWNNGFEPKKEKGPDIFCSVIEELSKKYKIHILLTGPARGYVKKRLTEQNIPFTHKFLKKFEDIVSFYNALDLYIITSREEGGPKAVLESMACGIPFVSTRVGMVPDIINNNSYIKLNDIDDIKGLAKNASEIFKNHNVKENITNEELFLVQKFDWSNIAKRYFNKIYKSL